METPKTMRALEVKELHGPESMQLVQKPIPTIGKGEVLVRVNAAGLNFADVMQSRGTYINGPKPPYIAGFEFAGQIVEASETSSWSIGQQVTGAYANAFAEYLKVPGKALMPLTEGWTVTQGASWFVNWVTAFGCLKTFGRLRRDETVLIHAAAGGVGQAAVRMAKCLGARVIATASSQEKLARVKQLGADECIDYTQQDFVAEVLDKTNGRGVDLVLEMVGGETFRKNIKATVPYGRILVYGAATAEQAHIDNVNLIFQPVELIGFHLMVLAMRRPAMNAKMIQDLIQLMREHDLTPDEPEQHPLEKGPFVLGQMEKRLTSGKIVLVP